MDTEIRVLIADDEQIARETMRDYLPWAEMGMQTPICVENGALALDHLCHDKIDIFIMDIRMPIMDGMALLEEITRRNIDVLIIVLSAYDQFEYAQKAISSRKVFEYVLKPIRRGNFCTLLQKAAAAVRSKRAESSPDSQALYDKVRKNYNGFLMQGHTAEGIALVRQKLEALPEPWPDWEGKKRFLIALYTDTQLEAVKQSTKNGQPACLPMNGLVQFEASHTDAELWQTFVSTVEELQTYLQPATAEASKASAVIEHCLRAIDSHYIHQKTGIGRLSAFCGATSAGIGAACGIAWLDGGDYEVIAHTIVNGLAILSGMVCDGAKPSCAAKIATAVRNGLLGYQMYRQGCQFYGGDGIVTKGVENTIANVGRLANRGMRSTDCEILNIMIGN